MPGRINWGQTHDNRLWALYASNEWDHTRNDTEYIIGKVRTHFNDWLSSLTAGERGVSQAVRRIREKNNIRTLQLEEANSNCLLLPLLSSLSMIVSRLSF